MGYIWQPSDNGFVNSKGEVGIWVKDTEEQKPNISYKPSGNNNSSYNPYMEMLKMQIEEQNRLRQEQLNLKRQQAEAHYNSRVKNINSGADEMQRQAYIVKKQGERILPQQLKAVGISGGDSESTIQNINASYKGNRYNTDIARQKSISEAAADKDGLNIKAYNDFLEGRANDIQSYKGNILNAQGEGNKNSANIKEGGRAFSNISDWAKYLKGLGYSDEQIEQRAISSGIMG